MGSPRSVTVIVNGRSPCGWAGASTWPSTIPESSARTSSAVKGTPSTAMSTSARGLKPEATTRIGSCPLPADT